MPSEIQEVTDFLRAIVYLSIAISLVLYLLLLIALNAKAQAEIPND